jgi:hypothetical protein
MMKVVIPLAGPDFVGNDGRVKSSREVGGIPLLRRALESRSWWRRGDVLDADLTFVLHDDEASRRFVVEDISRWYPRARNVFISSYTHGAALSVLSGLALVGESDDVLCIDLADIIFEDKSDPLSAFSDPLVGAIGLTFRSDNPVYSYIRRDAAGRVVEAAEKRVISNEASAGVYLFRSSSIYLRSLAFLLDNRGLHLYNNNFFLCPVFNGVIALGLKVLGLGVTEVCDFKFSLNRNQLRSNGA